MSDASRDNLERALGITGVKAINHSDKQKTTAGGSVGDSITMEVVDKNDDPSEDESKLS